MKELEWLFPREDRSKEEKRFVKYCTSLGWNSSRLKPHIDGKTWCGSSFSMPEFRDSHTQALFEGWCLRVNAAAKAEEVGCDARSM